MAAAAEQLTAGNALSAPPAILDFSNAAYLKAAVTAWPSCASPPPPSGTSAPSAVDLEALATAQSGSFPLTDVTQGDTNMCSAFAFAQGYVVKYALAAASGAIVPQLSPVYAYYLQRVEECSTTGVCPCPTCPVASGCTSKCDPPCVDCGSYILSAGSIYGKGVCTSADWPLTTPMNTPPTTPARAAAANQRVSGLSCVPVDAASIRTHLAAGNPVILFLNITAAHLKWMQALVAASTSDTEPSVSSPALAMVYTAGDKVTAGHVVCAVGYDAADNFIIRNSYGFKWGAQGRFAIPAASIVPQFIHEAAAITGVV
jgi:hypothetical protein